MLYQLSILKQWEKVVKIPIANVLRLSLSVIRFPDTDSQTLSARSGFDNSFGGVSMLVRAMMDENVVLRPGHCLYKAAPLVQGGPSTFQRCKMIWRLQLPCMDVKQPIPSRFLASRRCRNCGILVVPWHSRLGAQCWKSICQWHGRKRLKVPRTPGRSAKTAIT
jgi:hypothetical protein